jgi:N-alpha-acetyltransferase 40
MPTLSESFTNAMASITSTLKRRSIPTPRDHAPPKRTKLSSAPPKPRTNRRKAQEIAANSIAKANSLDPNTFTRTHIPDDKHTFTTTKDGKRAYTCTFRRTQDLSAREKEACFQIVKETSQADYSSHAEEGWDEDHKKAEMSESDMRFILVREVLHAKDKESRSDTPTTNLEDVDDTILGFTSFKLELDPDNAIPQVYIYEIHLKPSARGLGLGKHLMYLNECMARNVGLKKSILTVFTCNEDAEKMYRWMGYVEDECCPKTRKLRGGKVVRPKFLILSKAL